MSGNCHYVCRSLFIVFPPDYCNLLRELMEYFCSTALDSLGGSTWSRCQSSSQASPVSLTACLLCPDSPHAPRLSLPDSKDYLLVLSLHCASQLVWMTHSLTSSSSLIGQSWTVSLWLNHVQIWFCGPRVTMVILPIGVVLQLASIPAPPIWFCSMYNTLQSGHIV